MTKKAISSSTIETRTFSIVLQSDHGGSSASRSLRLSLQRAASRRYDMTGETGSYRYMAPEVFRHEPYNSKVVRPCFKRLPAFQNIFRILL